MCRIALFSFKLLIYILHSEVIYLILCTAIRAETDWNPVNKAVRMIINLN